MTKLMTTRNAATYVTAFCLVPVLALAQSPPPTAAVAPGAQYVTIGDKPAILYDAPSNKANRNFILGRFQPLEMLVKLDKWTKVRDTENTIGWVESAESSRIGKKMAAEIGIATGPTSGTKARG